LTVRQAALAYAQRMSEAGAPTSFDLAATLIGTGGIGVQIGTAAQAIAQGVSQANDRLASAGWPVVANLQLICISIARPRLTTPSEPWRRTIRSDMTSFHRWSFGLAPCADRWTLAIAGPPAGELGAERYAQPPHKQKLYALEEPDCDLTVDHRESWGDICRRLVARTAARMSSKSEGRLRSVTPSPLLLCCLPCGISDISGRLLFCLQGSFAFQALGLLTRCLLGISTSALHSDLGGQCGLTGDLPFKFLSSGLALRRAFGAGRHNTFTLAPLLSRRRIIRIHRLLKLGEHGAFRVGGALQPVLKR
jgi:hypothetical protein